MSRSGSLHDPASGIVSVALFSLCALSVEPIMAGLAAIAGVVFALRALSPRASRLPGRANQWAAVLVPILLWFRYATSVGSVTDTEAEATPIWIGLLIGSAVLGYFGARSRIWRVGAVVTGLAAVLWMTVALSVGDWNSEFGYDVYQMHRSAAAAIADGLNPYSDAVAVLDGSPFAEDGAVVIGYPYMPVSLLAYGVGALFFDPRLVSALCWLAVLAWFGWRTIRSSDETGLALGLFLLLAGLPLWPVIWFAGWTEPLSIALILITALFWKKRSKWVPLTMGLALGTKQYFVFLAPLLLVDRDKLGMKRAVASMGVAVATVTTGLLLGPADFIRSTFLNLSNIGFRPDHQSLTGLLASLGFPIQLPGAIWVIMSLTLAGLAAKWLVRRSGFFTAAGMTLALAFTIGHGLPNFWYLALSIMAIGYLVDPELAYLREEESVSAA